MMALLCLGLTVLASLFKLTRLLRDAVTRWTDKPVASRITTPGLCLRISRHAHVSLMELDFVFRLLDYIREELDHETHFCRGVCAGLYRRVFALDCRRQSRRETSIRWHSS
jgi:hypothetical protein